MKIMKKYMLMALCAAVVISTTQARPTFNASKDIIIAQFDSNPDPDDIHAQAALGCMLAHSSWSGVNCYAVAGAYGNQNASGYIQSRGLFAMAFGTENTDWTDAEANWWGSVSRIRAKAKGILNAGGKVWVAEAGQSKITEDWIWALINNDNIAESVIKANVIVVQHSKWNQDQTPAGDLNYVKQKADYYYIDDGNDNYGSTATWSDHGQWSTPNYRTKTSSYIASAKSSQNAKAKQLWTEADRIIDVKWPNGYPHDWSYIHFDGVDFSDTVEVWWILQDTVSNNNVGGFWSKYVTNSGGGGGGSAPIGQTIALKSKGSNKYVKANGAGTSWTLQAINNTVGGSWEKFKVEDAGGGYVALKSLGSNKYVKANGSGTSWKLQAINGTIGGSWEKFQWLPQSDGTVALKSQGSGKYVKANGPGSSWTLHAINGHVGGAWEKFTIEIQ